MKPSGSHTGLSPVGLHTPSAQIRLDPASTPSWFPDLPLELKEGTGKGGVSPDGLCQAGTELSLSCFLENFPISSFVQKCLTEYMPTPAVRKQELCN